MEFITNLACKLQTPLPVIKGNIIYKQNLFSVNLVKPVTVHLT